MSIIVFFFFFFIIIFIIDYEYLLPFKNEPPCDKTNNVACAPSEDSDQPWHPPSLIRVFAGFTCHFVGFVMRLLKCTCPRIGAYLIFCSRTMTTFGIPVHLLRNLDLAHSHIFYCDIFFYISCFHRNRTPSATFFPTNNNHLPLNDPTPLFSYKKTISSRY